MIKLMINWPIWSLMMPMVYHSIWSLPPPRQAFLVQNPVDASVRMPGIWCSGCSIKREDRWTIFKSRLKNDGWWLLMFDYSLFWLWLYYDSWWLLMTNHQQSLEELSFFFPRNSSQIHPEAGERLRELSQDLQRQVLDKGDLRSPWALAQGRWWCPGVEFLVLEVCHGTYP